MKAATQALERFAAEGKISIHAAREGGDDELGNVLFDGRISIHAAREGGDALPLVGNVKQQSISIHAAREGGDILCRRVTVGYDLFQSTPPVKAATCLTHG